MLTKVSAEALLARMVEREPAPLLPGTMTTTTSLPAYRLASPAAVLVRLGIITSALVGLMMF